jgi:hypothetical protein
MLRHPWDVVYVRRDVLNRSVHAVYQRQVFVHAADLVAAGRPPNESVGPLFNLLSQRSFR